MRPLPAVLVFLTAVAVPVLLFAANTARVEDDVASLLVNDDLYVAGGKVVVSEPVAGDAVIAGGSLIMNTAVDKDLLIAGGSILINGPVGDDVRAAGGDITILSEVGGDLIVLGGSVVVSSGAVIGGDVVVGAGNVTLAGTVGGDLLAGGGVIDLAGAVRGGVRIHGADELKLNGPIGGEAVFSARKVALGAATTFGDGVTYWQEAGELDFEAVPVAGPVRFDPDLAMKAGTIPSGGGEFADRWPLGPLGLWFLASFLAGTVVLVPLSLVFSGTFREASWHLSRAFWKSTLTGLLIVIVLPITAALLMVTVIGIPLGIFLFVAFLFALLFGRVIAALALATLIERRRNSTWGTVKLFFSAVGILLVLKLVGIIPLAGWLAILLAFTASLGAVMTALWEGRATRA